MGEEKAAFTILDWIVLGGYFVGITAFGLWMARRIRSSGGFFLGERKLPWWIMIGQAFGTGTHAENPVAQAGASFDKGFATIWYQWKNMLITPFYWLMAPWYRRAERTTIGEIVEDRYGRFMAFVYTVFALAYFVFNQGAMLKGAGKAISMATGGEVISPNGVVAAMVVTFILYSVLGGLVASAYTDFVQGFLIITLSFMLIPGGLSAVGGFKGMREVLSPDFFQLYSDVSGVTLFTITMLTLNGLVGITAQPHILSMNATGRTERAGRVGQTYGNMVKRFCTIGWALTGLIVAALVIRQGAKLEDPESAFGYASLHLLSPGLTGLMVACILAANMSTCSNFMVNGAALFTQNFYRCYFRPAAGDKELLIVGRISALVLALLGIMFAFYVTSVLHAFLFVETLPAFLGVMILGGILWRRANRWGALAATLSSIAIYYWINFQDTGTLQLVYKWKPAPFGWSMLTGFTALVVVSLLTRPESKERIEKFFDNMNRSTDGEGLPDGQPKPLAAELGTDLLLLDLTGWFRRDRWRGFFRRYREDLVGFALAWLVVGLLLAIAWGLMQLGK
ncbi:MAG: sodium:solute symporter family protein [Candidatus Sumerlaeia bacterium]|nr:sodium:solute symporter family protein [Candidatus Sumerlaeia bacterium]